MCYQTITTSKVCGHTERSFHRCKASFERAKRTKKVGFFKRLFCSPIEAAKAECKPSTCHSNLEGFCEGCVENQQQQRRQEQREEAKRYEAARSAHNKNESLRRLQRRRSERKRTFRCSKCAEEGRRVEDRTANEGLCCARGIDEWEARERAQGTYRKPVPLPKVSEHNPYTYTDLATGRPITAARAPDPVLRRMTSTAAAREAASKAARGYGWTRNPFQPAAVEAQIVSDFLQISGTDHRSLPPPSPETHYEEPGIDWDEWNRYPQSGHGRFPPPSTPPSGPLPPLPVAPLRTKSRPLTNRRRERPVPKAEVSPVSSSPVELPSPISPVSDSRFSENFHPPKQLRSAASRLDIELEEALNYWGEPEEDTSEPYAGVWQTK